MKFIISKLDVFGERTAYYTETFDEKTESTHHSFTIDKSSAKTYNSQSEANIVKNYLSDKLQTPIVVDYLESDDLLANKNDYNQLRLILDKYSPEDLAQAIVCNTDKSKRAKLLHEIYLLDTNQQSVI